MKTIRGEPMKGTTPR